MLHQKEPKCPEQVQDVSARTNSDSGLLMAWTRGGGGVVVLGSGDPRDQEEVKTTFPSNQEGGMGFF